MLEPFDGLLRLWSHRAVTRAGVEALDLQALLNWADQVPTGRRGRISIALIGPLALLLGVAFPVGLSRVAAQTDALIPWAWAVNGCASVVGAVLATLLAVHLGFSVVVILAIVLYLFAMGVVP